MDVDVLRRRPLDRLAGLPALAWLSIHVLLYLVVGMAGLALWDVLSGGPLGEAWVPMIFGALIVLFSPVGVLCSVAAAFCLGALRLLSDARWSWFRLTAILLFAVPFPLFLLVVNGPETALPVVAIQLVTALLIVQPRTMPRGWADRDPSMEDHGW